MSNTTDTFVTGTAWILTREPYPTNATIDLALAVFEKNDINQTKLKLVNQQDCEQRKVN